MCARLPLNVAGRVLEAAKNAYGFPIEKAELGGGCFPIKHCGMRLIQVSAFTKIDSRLPFSEGNKQQVVDSGICPVCLTAYVPTVIRPGMAA